MVKGLYPSIIIGVDFMRLNQMKIDYVNNIVQFYDGLLILPLQEFVDINNCAVAVSYTHLTLPTKRIV